MQYACILCVYTGLIGKDRSNNSCLNSFFKVASESH